MKIREKFKVCRECFGSGYDKILVDGVDIEFTCALCNGCGVVIKNPYLKKVKRKLGI